MITGAVTAELALAGLLFSGDTSLEIAPLKRRPGPQAQELSEVGGALLHALQADAGKAYAP